MKGDIPRRYRLDEFGSIPDRTIEPDYMNPPGYATNGAPPEPALTIVPLQQFANTTEDTAKSLLGTEDESVLPANGTLLMYGDGGAGKTTLTIDAMAHLAAGHPWLDIPIEQPLRILLIENEGPRGPFRKRLQQKISAWDGPDFHPNVVVLEEPWSRFTIADAGYRAELSAQITEHAVELVMVGPLASLGARGTGTPDDINAFDEHIKQLREHTNQTFALWIVHHENKAGDVSGAWERYPDTLVHIQAQGNGRTNVVWRKTRWSSVHHGTSVNLLWADGHGFTIEEKPVVDIPGELIAAFTLDNQWRTATEAKDLIGRNLDKVRVVLKKLTVDGVFTHQAGPDGRRSNALCWKLQTHSATPESVGVSNPFEGTKNETNSLTPPMKESVSELVELVPDELTSPEPSELDVFDPSVQKLLDPDPDIPF